MKTHILCKKSIKLSVNEVKCLSSKYNTLTLKQLPFLADVTGVTFAVSQQNFRRNPVIPIEIRAIWSFAQVSHKFSSCSSWSKPLGLKLTFVLILNSYTILQLTT